MADWGGFTEEDLRQLVYPGKIDMGKPPGSTPKKQANLGKQKGKNRERGFGQQKKRVTLSDVVEVMPVDQMLKPDSMSNGDAGSTATGGKDETKPHPVKPKNTMTPPKSVLKPSKPIERQISRTNSNSFGNDEKLVNNSLDSIESSRELNEEEALSRELNQIQKFQHQQKLIEEKNKQTKTLLAQAIKERRARAETEAHLLTDLQKELSRLDNLLTTDVSIIRNRIETASLEYTESQKRYERAEKEFVEAKMDLFRRAETKEKLTEHLYTIIYQNEMRKAQKLSELMEMLELTTSGEEVECILPAIPPIPIYNPVQTLYSPCKSVQTPQDTKDAGIANHESSDSGKPEQCDQNVVGQLVSNVSSESKESSSNVSASPSPANLEEGEEKQNDSEAQSSTNEDVLLSSQDLTSPETAEVKNAANPSVGSAKSMELEINKSDCDKESDVGTCDVSDNSIPDTAKLSSSLETNSEQERTSKDKKTTLKELVQ